MQSAKAAGIHLTPEAMRQLATMPEKQASELLESVVARRSRLRDPSNYICATIAKGYMPDAVYAWTRWNPGAVPLPERAQRGRRHEGPRRCPSGLCAAPRLDHFPQSPEREVRDSAEPLAQSCSLTALEWEAALPGWGDESEYHENSWYEGDGFHQGPGWDQTVFEFEEEDG